jgi:hypothetical protein
MKERITDIHQGYEEKLMRLFLQLVIAVVIMLEFLFLNEFLLLLHLVNSSFIAFGIYILLKKASLVERFFKFIIRKQVIPNS